MDKRINSFLLFFLVYFMIDMVWIVGARNFHVNLVEKVQKEPFKANYYSAFLLYLLAPLAYILLIEPHASNAKTAMRYGMAVGGLMSAAIDLTNKTIFRNYSWSYTFLDTWWGLFNMGITTLIVYKIRNKPMAKA